MFGISDMKKEVGFMQLQEAVGGLWYRGFCYSVYIFTCTLTILDPNVYVLPQRELHWGRSMAYSFWGGREMCGGGKGSLSWCLWSSGATWAERAEPCEQPLATSALPARMRRTPSILQRGEHGEFQHWWQHVKQLQSLAGAQLLSGPVYCLSEKHFPNKTWKSGVLEDLHFLGRDNGAFFEI